MEERVEQYIQWIANEYSVDRTTAMELAIAELLDDIDRLKGEH